MESGANCSAHHMTNSRKWKTWGTIQRGKLDSQTWNPYHKVFKVAEKVNWEVLEVCTRQDGVRDLPLLVYEQVLLRFVYTMYSQSHVNGLSGLHNECRIDTNLFYSNDIEKGV